MTLWHEEKLKFDSVCDTVTGFLTPSYVKVDHLSKIANEWKILEEWARSSVIKRIKEFKFLFRASDHNFNNTTFHDMCNDIHNTIVLIKTEHGKVIGGFNPHRWNETQNFYDSSNRTFIFSLSSRQKLINTRGCNSIYCHPEYGPSFGNQDIWISKNCNSNEANNRGEVSKIYTYKNSSYIQNQDPYKAWTGHTSGSGFKIKDYEVYEVILENKSTECHLF